jgi:hypothetical protein
MPRRAVVAAILALPGAAPADQFVYRLDFEVAPWHIPNINREVELRLDHMRSPMNPAQYDAARATIRREVENQVRGIKIKTTAIIDLSPQQFFATSPSVNLERPEESKSRPELFDGQNTYIAPYGPRDPAIIAVGNTVNSVSSPIYRMALAGAQRVEGGLVRSNPSPNGDVEETIDFESLHLRLVRTFAKRRLVSIVGYLKSRRPFVRVDVLARTAKGEPKTIRFAYFRDGDQQPRQTETYTLIKRIPSRRHQPSELIRIGQRVIDQRLGPAHQVSYKWQGRLPTLDELRTQRPQ